MIEDLVLIKLHQILVMEYLVQIRGVLILF